MVSNRLGGVDFPGNLDLSGLWVRPTVLSGVGRRCSAKGSSMQPSRDGRCSYGQVVLNQDLLVMQHRCCALCVFFRKEEGEPKTML